MISRTPRSVGLRATGAFFAVALIAACACKDGAQANDDAGKQVVLPPFDVAKDAKIEEFVTDRVLIRYAFLPNKNPVTAQGQYVAWRSHLRLGDDLQNGQVDRSLIDKFLRGAFAAVVGSSTEKAAIVVRVNEAPPIMLMESQVTRIIDDQSGDFVSGAIVAPYSFFDGAPQPLSISANVTQRRDVDAPIVKNVLKLGRWVAMSSGMPAVLVNAASGLTNAEAKEAQEKVNEWLSSGGDLGKRTKNFTSDEVARLQKVQIVVFDKAMADPKKKAAVSVEIEPAATLSMLTQKSNDGRPDYSDITRDMLDRKIAPLGKSYRELLSDQLRGDLRENDRVSFIRVCEEGRKTFTQNGFSNTASNSDVLALTWATLAQSRYYENQDRAKSQPNCPDRSDISVFNDLHIPWKSAPVRPVEEIRDAQKRSMTNLSAMFRRGVDRKAYFSDMIVFYEEEDIVKNLDHGRSEKREQDVVLSNLRQVARNNTSIVISQFSLDGMEDAGRIPFQIGSAKYELWAYFENEDVTVEGNTVRRIYKLEITRAS